MAVEKKTYTIIHREGSHSDTVQTGLTIDQAKDWLAKKGAELGQKVSQDLIVRQPGGDGTWSAVEAE